MRQKAVFSSQESDEKDSQVLQHTLKLPALDPFLPAGVCALEVQTLGVGTTC